MTENYKTQYQLKIDWADLDLFGHVNNVAFFKYVQSARVSYCETIGLTSLNTNEQLSFMVASSQCQFKKPLLYPNQIIVFSKVEWIKNSSFQLAYLIVDKNQNVIAEAADVLVVFDHHKKVKALISNDLKQRMEQIEGHALGL